MPRRPFRSRPSRPSTVAVLSAAVLAGALAGCSFIERGDQALASRDSVVGLTEQQVLQCAGRPDRVRRDGGVTRLVYERGDLYDDGGRATPEIVTDNTLGSGGLRVFVGDSGACEVNVYLRNGVVSSVDLRTPSGGLTSSRYAACEPVLRRCSAAP